MNDRDDLADFLDRDDAGRDTDVTAEEIADAIARESAALDATWAQWAERGAL